VAGQPALRHQFRSLNAIAAFALTTPQWTEGFTDTSANENQAWPWLPGRGIKGVHATYEGYSCDIVAPGRPMPSLAVVGSRTSAQSGGVVVGTYRPRRALIEPDVDRPVLPPSLASRSRAQLVGVGLAVLAAVVVITIGLVARPSSPPAQPQWDQADQALTESFESTSLNTGLWNTCYWWECTIPTNKELQWYEPSQVRLMDGQVHLVAEALPVRTGDGETFPYRSGMISSGPAERDGRPKFAFTYGTVEARLQVPAGRGLWSALWMLPAFGESRPEVDIVEVLGHDTRTSYQSLHRTDRDREPLQHVERGSDLADGWHVYRLEWLPGSLRWYVDDRLVFTVEGEDVPDEPMYIMANLAVGGSWPGFPNNTTRFPASMSIDYIEVWPRGG